MVNLIRSKLIVYLRKVLRWIYARRLGQYPALKRLVEGFQKSESAAVDLADAIALYEHVLRLKPKCILELGPGTSTNVICLAIKEIQASDPEYCPIFLSFEEDPQWSHYHENLFEPSLRKYVKLDVLPTAKKQVKGSEVGPAAYYVGLPKLPYDFVFIDGPRCQRHECKWSCDVLELLEFFAQRVWIVFDSREITARQIWKLLRNEGFQCKRNPYSLCYEIWRE